MSRTESNQENHRVPGGPTDLPSTRPSAVDHGAILRGAVERVVISQTTIEIELAESAAGDEANRILIIPWTPPSPHRRREIIQGESPASTLTGFARRRKDERDPPSYTVCANVRTNRRIMRTCAHMCYVGDIEDGRNPRAVALPQFRAEIERGQGKS
jgi:hypothetical protein